MTIGKCDIRKCQVLISPVKQILMNYGLDHEEKRALLHRERGNLTVAAEQAIEEIQIEIVEMYELHEPEIEYIFRKCREEFGILGGEKS
jgi:hypothetical protein